MAKGGKEIRRRIKSVKNTQQITKAMKMVAASRLRKSESRTQASRPYADTLREVMSELGSSGGGLDHPFLKHIAAEVPRVILVVMSSDKGLAGSYNSNLFKKAEEFIRGQKALGRAVDVVCAGKKAWQYFKLTGQNIIEYVPSFTNSTTFADLNAVTGLLTRAYLESRVSEVYLLYAKFVNVVKNVPTVIRLLPIETPAETQEQPGGFRQDFELEPDPQQLLELLLPRYFQTVLFQAAIESFTSENGARMVAMENATKAAGEMIDALTLQYNKARQSGITLELLDIVGGAEALKG